MTKVYNRREEISRLFPPPTVADCQKRRTRKKGAPLGVFSCYLVAAAAAATTAVVIAASAAAGVAAAIAATANQKQDDNPPDVAAEASVIPTHKKVPPCFLEFSEL